jgi:hypothetical protein
MVNDYGFFLVVQVARRDRDAKRPGRDPFHSALDAWIALWCQEQASTICGRPIWCLAGVDVSAFGRGDGE